jgi:hypothetical protein
MTYSLIEPPFPLKLWDLSKEQLREYGRWFGEMIGPRIAELSTAVQSTPGYETWRPDASPQSLSRLSEWFVHQVQTRRRSKREIQDIVRDQEFPIDVPQEELTERTFSLAIDIGMYFGEVVRRNVPGTRWEQMLTRKNDADYGQLVVKGTGSVPLNPVRILITLAYGIASGNQGPKRLIELYDVWEKMLSTPSKVS